MSTLLAFACGALGAAGLAQLALGARPRSRLSARGRRRVLSVLARAGALGREGLRPPGDLGARVVAAGLPEGIGVREVMAAKLAAALGASVLALPLSALAPGRLGPALLVAAPVAGFLAPDAWLASRARDRARAVRRELPAMLDLLRITVEAGASLPAALAEVGTRTHGPLAQEWRAVGREVELGVPLSAALAGLVRRLPQAEVAAVVGALERARRHGAPVAETLAAQAHDARLALRRRVQEEAARAGPKIQLVVALLLVPSVLLLVAAALAAALLGSGGMLLPA